MGKYTVQGSAEFEQQVDSDLQRVVDAIHSLPQAKSVLAVVLAGGYGRGEGTPFLENGIQKPFNDYDLIVISQNLSKSEFNSLKESIRQLEQPLTEAIGIHIDLYLHSPSTLKHAEPSLLNFEVRYGHRVIHGPQDILEAMPNYSLTDVPLDEGTRLLLNRGKLLLDVKVGLGGDSPLSEEKIQRFKKFIWKSHLAFGDCLLLAFGNYDVSYREKAKRIESYLTEEDLPDPQWMISRYLKAIEFKFNGDLSVLGLDDLYHAFSDTVRYYLGFLLWYEGRRLGTALPSLQTYCAKLPLCSTSGKQKVKALALNGSLLGAGMFSPNYRWALMHPRNRLYPALWLLLSFESSIHMDLGLMIQLLNGDRNYGKLLQRFYDLRARLA
ncbi:MAG: hypothetical protein Q8K75_06540 [Chlamydiales bacterium]|nr:hypothetical protein [Chlamydiales bacterium]